MSTHSVNEFNFSDDLAPRKVVVRSGEDVFILVEASAYAANCYRKCMQENTVFDDKGEVVGVKPGIAEGGFELLGDCLWRAVKKDGGEAIPDLDKAGNPKRMGTNFVKHNLTERQRRLLLDWVTQNSDLFTGVTEEQLENTIAQAQEALAKLREGKASGQNTP